MSDADRPADEGRAKLAGRLLVLLAAVMWSTSGFFAHAPVFEDWPREMRGPLLAFWRAAFACVALLPMVRRPRWSIKLLPMVVIFATMNVTFLSAMAYTEPAKVVWLQYTAPMWVFVISLLWLREPAQRGEWLMLACSMLGVGLILLCELRGEAIAGVVLGLLSGVTFTGVVLSLRSLRDQDSAWLIALNHLVTALLLAPYMLYQGVTHDVWPRGGQWLFMAGFGMLQMGIPYVLFARGLRSISGHEASGIVLLEPILVPLWVFIAWHSAETYEAPRWWTFAGGGLILAGLLARYIGARSSAREKPP